MNEGGPRLDGDHEPSAMVMVMVIGLVCGAFGFGLLISSEVDLLCVISSSR